MVTGLETGASAVTLAELAVKAVQLVRSVINAPAEADLLCERAQDAGDLADIVERVIDSRGNAGIATGLSVESSIHTFIRRSLSQCRKCLIHLNVELQPFKDAATQGVSPELKKKYKFVRSKDFLQQQETTLGKLIANLNLSLNLLNHIDLLILRNTRGQKGANLDEKHQGEPSPTEHSEKLTTNTQRHESREHQVEHVVESKEGRGEAEENLQHRQLETAVRDRVSNEFYDPTKIQKIVEAGDDILFKDEYGWTFLHYAAKHCDFETLTMVLDCPDAQKPVYLNAASAEGETALIVAATHADDARSILLAAALIEKGCDVNIKDFVGREDGTDDKDATDRKDSVSHGRSALYHALDGAPDIERVNFVILLEQHGADVEEMRRAYPGKYEKFEKAPLFAKLSPTQHGRRRSSAAAAAAAARYSKRQRSTSGSALTRSKTEPATMTTTTTKTTMTGDAEKERHGNLLRRWSTGIVSALGISSPSSPTDRRKSVYQT